MVTYRCGSGRERAPEEPSASDVLADVKTFACGLTIRCVCRQKLDRSASAHWRGQVAISTAVRRGATRDACSICEESGDRVRASEIVMLACAVFSAMRPLHVIASEAKQSILSLRRHMDCFASLAMTVDTVSPSRGADRPRFASSLVAQKSEGAGKTGCTLHPRSRVPNAQTKTHTSIQVQRKHSGLPCAMALRLIASSPR